MSLLLSSIILFILVTPGLVFRFSYLHGTYAKANFKLSAVDEITWALIPALFFQLVTIAFLEQVFSVQIRIDLIYKLINGEDSSSIDFIIIRTAFIPFIGYVTLLFILSVIAGLSLRYAVIKFQLDINSRFFRLNNEWHYVFTGKILDFPGMPGDSENIDFIQVDLLSNAGDGDFIYSGIVQDYFLSSNNGLDRIHLIEVYRRKLSDDLEPAERSNVQQLDERYYQMPGELFVIQYEKILNMNVTYHRFSLDEVEENESEAE